ncbi:MAG: ArsR family transcriptional regulator [Gammaproteobacteria bacterium]|nr:ArsR family transcriptional regulator [Gammaproteobacteria bacterium]
MDYGTYTDKERRLALLRLIRDGGGKANERSLYNAIRDIGYPLTTRDDVRADLELLGKRNCIVKEMHKGLFLVATLSEVGRDVADGKLAVEGVKRGDPADAL